MSPHINKKMLAKEQSKLLNQERAFVQSLLEASLEGNGAKVKELVSDYSTAHNIPSQQVLAEFKDGEGRTALHFACHSATPVVEKKEQREQEEIVSLLLHWIPPNAATELLSIKDKNGMTPLMLAASNKNGHLAEGRVNTILHMGGDKLALARSKAGATALHYASAAEETTPATLQRLYQAAKVALNTNSLQGGTPLHWAAAESPPTNHLTVLKTLVETCGANVNATNEQNLTALIMAAAARNDVHCQYLVQAGADISTILPGDINIFHMVADLNLVKTLQALLETQDTTTVQEYCQQITCTGETPLEVALHQGNVECVMLLSGEQNANIAQAMIDEAKSKAPPKPQCEENDSTKIDTDEPSLQTKAIYPEEQQVMEIMKKMKEIQISDDDIALSIEYKQQGNQHYADKQWKQAMDCYTEAIQLNPTDATFYSNRSACFMELGQPQEALMDAMMARQLRPTWAKACYRMSVAQLALGRYEDAAVAAFEGLQHDEDNVELQQLLKESVAKGRKEHEAKQKDTSDSVGGDSRKKVLVANVETPQS